MESMFVREKYLKKVKPYIGKNIIKVLTGQRRVGKTIILKQIMDLVKQEVYIGKNQDREIDFVAQKGNKTKYIQVAYQLPDEKVREREFGNLLKIEDNYEKIVVSADEFAEDYKGIKHMHINQFLANE